MTPSLTKKERHAAQMRGARRDEIEAWWALIARVLSFIGGMLVIANDAFLQNSQATEIRLAFLFGGIALIGPVVASSLAEILQAARGGSDGG